jgi:hypothetical protein
VSRPELRCAECGKVTTRLEASLRVFNCRRCGLCGGVLLPREIGPTLLVGARRAAEIAEVHENTIRNWKSSGRLPVGWTMPNGQSRYRAIDVARAARYPFYFAPRAAA